VSRNITVDPDGFGAAMKEILTDAGIAVRRGASEAVKKGLSVASKSWKKNARAAFSGRYRKGGYVYTAGEYAASISYKMIRSDGELPHGEAGSRKLPGLPHLLEKGHATLGGGRVPGRLHIAPAAEEAFKATEEYMEEEIGKRLDS